MQVTQAGGPLELVEREVTEPGAGQVRIRAMTQFFPLERAAEAYDLMMSGKARFRAVHTTEVKI
jgi:D-arabinose 1-dehydrogenase-like Zn-dependent alcohol dehydrogenase